MSLQGWFLNKHWTQYAPGQSVVTRRAGCTWTTGANGAYAATGGRVNLTPDQVHALVRNSEETSPTTPGWSLDDLDLAMSRAGVRFEIRSGWANLVAAHRAGLYVSIPGDSDRFGNNTCSGDFDGDHNIGAHPASRQTAAGEEWWIDDPICPTGRWERATVIRAYAEKFNSAVRFGVFLPHVPYDPSRWKVAIDAPAGHGVKLYTKPGGTVVGAVGKATYICLRSRLDGAWWYRIIATASGRPSVNVGRSFKPNRYVEATRL